MGEGVLSKERTYFDEIKPQLLQTSEGKFVLIKDRRLIGTYDSPARAYEEGIARLGNVPMLIIQVRRTESKDVVPALTLGVIRASLP